MDAQYQKAIAKLKDFVDGAEQHGWKLKAVRFSFANGIAKYGVDVQNENGETLHFNC